MLVMNQIEIWKDIEGYEGLYQVSNMGRVRSLDRVINGRIGNKVLKKGKILLQHQQVRNYYSVSLSKENKKKTHRVHRLKAIVFIPNPQNKPEVNHRDGDKSNNGYNSDGKDNLEWATSKENHAHAYSTGIRKSCNYGRKGKDSHVSIPVVKLTTDSVLVDEYDSLTLGAESIGKKSASISNVLAGRKKHTGGFKWMYKSDYYGA